MALSGGALLWNRQRITLAPGQTEIDTGLTQVNRGVDPPLGIFGTTPPLDGSLPASRVQVLPMAPLLNWADITHGEPYFNTDTQTVHVLFDNSAKTSTSINVLFWDPHTLVSPGDANTYNAGI